ncbi:Polysaccharide biosynthesis protein [Nitrosococcus oceani ATCC 19707]|uniref:Polysaccharide biosynthesis protein n=1 Tax=Nitrosococcus oceani (strain ATCC 19707 / BCRC 17464 / JCM 30415 / NCIMB 11848 / C-107) TaxID=323261 RepID=Q3J9U2_NITOC|nr:lipopolysaccharide biosynthesis protein [Nitrosococcus oceani]ABA58404.1 Polysaccharide biosynthesis protein [Nitrosococcus oceani ATCC 19707]GEM18799.1 lipopolysaccharide biosynthesis protein [Nitrosococcus oceani]
MLESKTEPGVRHSIVVTTLNRYAVLVISLVSTMVLARLLTPAEIGIFSMAVVFVNLAHSMRDFGVGRYIVQEKELTVDRIRSAFGITLGIAWSMAIVLAIAAPWVADFYGDERVTGILRVLAVNFVLIPFGSVVLSYLNREMQFTTIFLVGVISEFVRAASGIWFAWIGLGAMSLAWSALLGVIATVVLARILGPSHFILRPAFCEWRRVMSFGGRATLATIAFQFQRGAPEVVIGRYLSAAAVGFFSKALGVIRLFDRTVLSAVSPAILPHMAAKHRSGESVAGFYAHGLGLITALAWPCYAFIAIMAFPVVRILFGDQWDAAVPLARILAIYAAVDALYAFTAQALIAVGAVHLLVRLRVATLLATVLALVLAVSYGLEVVAFAMVFPAVVGLIYSSLLMRSAIGLKGRVYLKATAASLLITAATVAFPLFYLGMPAAVGQPHWQFFIISAAGGSAGWMVAVITLRHPIWDELRLLFSQARNRLWPVSS